MIPTRVALPSTVLTAGLMFAVFSDGAPLTEDPFTGRQRSYWAFQRVQRPAVPEARRQDRLRNPIDAFIVHKLEEKQIEPGDPADKAALLRRAYFDLTGLPPTPQNVAVFLRDDDPDAFAGVVDRLLASPQYGERWGRHWLDLARYAESEGFKADETRPNAWRYRDYVIQAFNQDKPYDLFIKEQIAGDELWPENFDALVATAFNRNFPDETNAANLRQRRQEILHDMTDTVGATFLGLTYGCAKCHDHKFDPISQKDYYRLQAFFANTAEDDDVILLGAEDRREYKAGLAEWEEATKDIRARIEELFQPPRKKPGSISSPDALRKPASCCADRLQFRLPTIDRFIASICGRCVSSTPKHALPRDSRMNRSKSTNGYGPSWTRSTICTQANPRRQPA